MIRVICLVLVLVFAAPAFCQEPINVMETIKYLRPGAKFMVWENDPTRIVWNDTDQTQPTLAEIATAWATVEKLLQDKEAEEVIATTNQELAGLAFAQLILTEFPQLAKIEDLTPEMIDTYLTANPLDKNLMGKFMKAFLFYIKTQGGL